MARSERPNAEEYSVLAYGELRRMAAGFLAREPKGITLQPTALVHEAYMRLAKSRHLEFVDRTHFLGVAARAMRQILVERARGRKTAKRDSSLTPPILLDGTTVNDEVLTAVDEALTRLAELDPRQAEIVELRFFGGLSGEETAEYLDISLRTIRREWSSARAWLQLELRRAGL